jgi:hypothetical protein
VDIVLGSTAVLADALEWVAAVRRVTDLEAHTTGGFVEDWDALFHFLADLGAAGIAHAGADHVFEGEVVLLKPGWVHVVIMCGFGAVVGATSVRQTPRSIDHSN